MSLVRSASASATRRDGGGRMVTSGETEGMLGICCYCITVHYLVGGLELTFFIFPYIGNNNPQLTFIFFRGVGIPPTSYYTLYIPPLLHPLSIPFGSLWDSNMAGQFTEKMSVPINEGFPVAMFDCGRLLSKWIIKVSRFFLFCQYLDLGFS